MEFAKAKWEKYLINEKYHSDQTAFRIWDKRFAISEILARDLPRIRTESEYLHQETPKKELTLLITFFCLQNKISYQQGMLDLCVPFLLLRIQEVRLSKCYALFSAFMRKNKNLYLQKNVIKLQKELFKTKVELPYSIGSLYFLRLLLCYHAPQLVSLFESQHWNLLSGWIMTLFSQKTPLVQTMIIFDRYIKTDNPMFVLYLSLALILRSQEDIEMYLDDPDSFIEFVGSSLQKINFKSEQEIDEWFEQAREIREQTPESFEYLLEFLEFNSDSILSQQDINFFLESLDNQLDFFYVQPSEVIKFFRQSSRIKDFVLVDCRKSRQIYIRNLKSLTFLKQNPNFHYILVLNKDQKLDSVRKIIQTEFQMKYISVLQGGFENLLLNVIKENINLEIGSFFTKVKWFFIDLFSSSQDKGNKNYV